ncbi:MAG: PQQ-binding-like beta-propeller repeat protein [Alphaproteobacteria bacterium]|nr:PQQ-binding-like beta-propeller repeat protein [Alphaproteobacteria bacterium]
MRILLILTGFISALLISGCSYFNSEPEKARLPGERISILDLQQELQPSASANAAQIEIPPVTHNKDWPQAGGYAHHVMQNLELGEIINLERIWSADIGDGSSSNLPLNAQPVIADGAVFTLDSDHRVSAFHTQTGKEFWRADISHKVEKEEVIAGGLAYGGGILYATSGYNEILALNPKNGEIYWRTDISAPSRAAPTIHNGRVFVSCMNNNVVALDARSGKILWEYEGVGETTGLLGAASPAVDDDMVIAGFASGDLIALQVQNGSVIWSDNLANTLRFTGMGGLSDIRGLPVIYGDVALAVSYGNKMIALDKRNGNRLWQQTISSAETPWVSGNSVFVLSTDYKLYALDIRSGQIIWVQEVQRYKKPESKKGLIHWTGPLMANNQLLLIGNHGDILALDPANGAEQLRIDTGRHIRLAPTIAQGALYLLDEGGTLAAYR